jgi:single-strand DNA-binding protein
LNKIILLGRICKDLELKKTGETSVIKFTLAVNRKFNKQGEEKQADFISCVAFGKTAEIMEQYLGKGRQIAIEGRIQTGSYKNKEGVMVYTTDVIVESFNFADGQKKEDANDGFKAIDENDDELPF